MKLQNYKKTDPAVWQGRVDSSDDRNSFRWHQVVELLDIKKGDELHDIPVATEYSRHYAILGFCSDEGVRRNKGRVGAVQGPEAIRQAMANMPVHFQENITIYDAGDIVCNGHGLEKAQDSLSEAVSILVSKNIVPIVLGGGHEVAFGHGRGLIKSLMEKGAAKRLGILNFDAHFDLRPLEKDKGTSGTPFLQLAGEFQTLNKPFQYLCMGIQKSSNTKSLFQKAKELGVEYILRDDMHAQTSPSSRSRLDRFLAQVDAIYLTICLDVFAAAFAPGVSAPAAYGIFPDEFFPVFQHIVKTGKIMGFDCAEMSPPYDRDGQTACLAAKIVFEFITKQAS